MTRHRTKDGILHFLTKEQMAEEIIRLDAALAAAPAAQAAPAAVAGPAYKDCTPDLHIGDSSFESWYSNYVPAHKGDKQRARDAYATGMGDPLVTAAPVAQGDAEQRQMDAKHAAIYRWMLSNIADAWNIIDNWRDDAEAGTYELHDALAARAQAKEGGAP